jgi:hypothetical protein
MAANRTYLSAVATSVAQAVLTAAWIAAGGLPPARRRTVRAGASAAVAAAGVLAGRRDDPEITWTPETGLVVKGEDGTPRPRPSTNATAAAVVLGLGMIVTRRQIEKRWLARLQRDGHEHPYRRLALRMGLLTVATTLPEKLIAARREQRDQKRR